MKNELVVCFLLEVHKNVLQVIGTWMGMASDRFIWNNNNKKKAESNLQHIYGMPDTLMLLLSTIVSTIPSLVTDRIINNGIIIPSSPVSSLDRAIRPIQIQKPYKWHGIIRPFVLQYL